MAPIVNGIGLAATDMATTITFYRRLGLDLPSGPAPSSSTVRAWCAELGLPGLRHAGRRRSLGVRDGLGREIPAGPG